MYEMGPWERREDLDTWLPGDWVMCSFCGSLKPDHFLDRVREGWKIDPTDKTYKAYIHNPSGGQHKVYFQHLSEDQKREFVDLYNSGTVNLGVPGVFYVMPFFMRPVDSEESNQ
jgi:hypothetical protein